MNTAVVFSVTIFKQELVNSIYEWLQVFESKFKNCDFYIGVNYGTNQKVIEILKTTKINKNIIVSPQELYATSDASAYQAALYGLKKSGKKYDYYWFGHTKGGVNPRQERRKYYTSEFFGKREEIEIEISENNPGVYGLNAITQSADGVTQWKDLSVSSDHGGMPIVQNINFDRLNYEHINISLVETFFVMKGELVNWFIRNAKDEWYFTKIQDRYYFEVVFPWLASRYGMGTYVKNKKDFLNHSINIPKMQFSKKIL